MIDALLFGWFGRAVFESMRGAGRRRGSHAVFAARDVVVALKGDERP